VSVGDRVQCGGGMASSVVTNASSCWKIPDHYSFLEGAAFSTGYSTAYHCLIERGQLQPGETVLVHGATGGMGMAAVHIAKAVGATIIATGGSDNKLRVCCVFGADQNGRSHHQTAFVRSRTQRSD
jgi:NADPH:quinone reductase